MTTPPLLSTKRKPTAANYSAEESKRLFQLREAAIAENARVDSRRAEVEAARAALHPLPPEAFVPSGIAQESIKRMNAYRHARRGSRGRAAATLKRSASA